MSKGLRHIQMRENRIRENIISQFVSIQHVHGKINLADIFTKEMKDTTHFVELRDMFMCPKLQICLLFSIPLSSCLSLRGVLVLFSNSYSVRVISR
jgi:hypothetical protein